MMGRLALAFSFALLAILGVQAQQNPGFISIDCGAPNAYTDKEIGIAFETDEGFIDSGKNMQVSTEVIYEPNQQLSKNLRSFPNGTRNCYTLRPKEGKNNSYLIRASFWYGNYDGKNQHPVFDLYIDVNYWTTVNYSVYSYEEIIYVSQADDIQVCLVNTGNGVPFISALELRAFDDDIYRLGSGFLKLDLRYDIGRRLASKIRHPVDVYDRIWTALIYDNWFILTTTSAIDSSDHNDACKYKIPGEVLGTAQSTMNASSPLSFKRTPLSSAERWILYFHFVEIERLTNGPRRELAISMNGNQFKETVSLEYLKPAVVVSTPVSGSLITFSIDSKDKSGNPPFLNAVEFYTVRDLPNVPTAQDDVKAINDIKGTYHIKRESWQGDPCVPSKYAWDGLDCSYENPPRIISLKLSSSNLMGNIVPSLSHLSRMEYLDLSNNQLTGAIPETLAELQLLRFLNLSGNNLTGSVPEALKKRVGSNPLNMSLTGNANLCQADTCPQKKKQNTTLIAVVTSVSGFLVLCGAVAIIRFIKWKRMADSRRGTLRLKSRPFKYREVSRITGNFTEEIGEGGYGKVYLGTLDNDTRVAVKMLSKSSDQGQKEFQAEAQLLTILHHGNLVSLLGYCNDPKHLALIYEYMVNGNLRQLLSGDRPEVLTMLTWGKRIEIAVDVARGLDYLHNGCNPPIIHRDLKTTNILLNEGLRAKISDFGLSRALANDNDSHVSTRAMGTPGYIDPEYQSSGISKKSDVYSFGIILFELITGQTAIVRGENGGESSHILQRLTPFIDQGDIQSIMDPRLGGRFKMNSAKKVVETAVCCTRPTGIQRPDMDNVLAALQEALMIHYGGSPIMTSMELHLDIAPPAR